MALAVLELVELLMQTRHHLSDVRVEGNMGLHIVATIDMNTLYDYMRKCMISTEWHCQFTKEPISAFGVITAMKAKIHQSSAFIIYQLLRFDLRRHRTSVSLESRHILLQQNRQLILQQALLPTLLLRLPTQLS